jgi:hypothetical protein
MIVTRVNRLVHGFLCQIYFRKKGKLRTTRAEAPKDFGGRLTRNFDLTTPELPWGLVTRPQITRIFEPLMGFCAL